MAKDRTRTVPVRAPSGQEMQMLVVDHQNGQDEAVGFFCIRRNFQAVLSKTEDPKAATPKRFNSLADAKAWVEKKAKRELRFSVTSTGGIQAMPITWHASSGKDVFEIAYVGSFSYHDGRPVDPLVVGTEAENPSGGIH